MKRPLLLATCSALVVTALCAQTAPTPDPAASDVVLQPRFEVVGKLALGTHQVSVRKAGFETTTRTLDVTAGNIASDLFNFEKRAKSFVDFASGGGKTVSFKANEAEASPKIASSFATAGPLDEDFHLRIRAEFDSAATPLK